MTSVLRWDGKPISLPGWYDRVPILKYHSAELTLTPSVSSSGLRLLWRKSPKHFYADWAYNPNREEDDGEESAAFTLGRAAHHLFLGEDDFALQFIERPEKIAGKDWHGNRLECRAFLDMERKAGRTVLKPEQVKIIRGMARSLADEPLAIELLQGAVEQTLVARDPETGLFLKVRPDVIPTADGIHSDLKTTESVLDFDLKMSLRNYGYHQQGALIWEVCELLGLPFEGFVLVFVEKKPPYCTRVVELTDEDLSRGRQQNRAMIRLIKKCIDAGSWPGPGQSDAEFFSMPQAEQEWIDKRLQELEAA